MALHTSYTVFWCFGQQGIWQLDQRVFTFLSTEHRHSWHLAFLLGFWIPDLVVYVCSFRISIPNDLNEKRTPDCSVWKFYSLPWIWSFTNSLLRSLRYKRRRWRFLNSRSENFEIQIMNPITAVLSIILNQKTIGQWRIFRLQIYNLLKWSKLSTPDFVAL